MPSPYEVEDRGSMSHLVATAGDSGRISVIKKKIVRCGNYEFHHQYHQDIQLSLLDNMYTNYVKIKGIDEAEIKTVAQAEELMLAMLRYFGALWYWDPNYQDPMAERSCDLNSAFIIEFCFEYSRSTTF